MTWNWMTNILFVELQKNMDKKAMVGQPVLDDGIRTGTKESIGIIRWYNPKTGMTKVELKRPISYLALLRQGVKPNHIGMPTTPLKDELWSNTTYFDEGPENIGGMPLKNLTSA